MLPWERMLPKERHYTMGISSEGQLVTPDSLLPDLAKIAETEARDLEGIWRSWLQTAFDPSACAYLYGYVVYFSENNMYSLRPVFSTTSGMYSVVRTVNGNKCTDTMMKVGMQFITPLPTQLAHQQR